MRSVCQVSNILRKNMLSLVIPQHDLTYKLKRTVAITLSLVIGCRPSSFGLFYYVFWYSLSIFLYYVLVLQIWNRGQRREWRWQGCWFGKTSCECGKNVRFVQLGAGMCRRRACFSTMQFGWAKSYQTSSKTWIIRSTGCRTVYIVDWEPLILREDMRHDIALNHYVECDLYIKLGWTQK